MREQGGDKRKKKWEGPVYLTVEQLSQMMQVSCVWLYKLCAQGRIPFYRFAGKVIRFDPEEIQTWLEENRGGKYRRGKGKKDSDGKGQGSPCASQVGENDRAPAMQSGRQG